MIDVSKLTPEQKAALLEELKKGEKTKADAEREKREAYKKMVVVSKSDIPMAAAVLIANVFLLYANWNSYKHLFEWNTK